MPVGPQPRRADDAAVVVIYLSGSCNAAMIAAAGQPSDLGLLIQPGAKYAAKLGHFKVWAADNGCFAHPERFDVEAYIAWLQSMGAHAGRCLFATAPDVLADAPVESNRTLDVRLLELERLLLLVELRPRLDELSLVISIVTVSSSAYEGMKPVGSDTSDDELDERRLLVLSFSRHFFGFIMKELSF